MKNKNYIFYAICLILSVYILLVCLSNCTYYIFGDSVVYMRWLTYLDSGEYFQQNWNALTTGTAEHIRLTTEGGYIFFLWFASLINRELPFFISAFFVAGFLSLFTLLVIFLDKPKKRATLTGLITLVLIFCSYDISKELMILNTCLRDGAAHFFGILGLLSCCIGVKKQYAKKYLFSGCLFIGIACWCRVPNILFVIPAGVYALLNIKKSQLKKIFSIALIMFAGLIIGLLPLFSQNIFEGKSFYKAGQTDTFVTNKATIDEQNNRILTPAASYAYRQESSGEIFQGVKKGVSFKNFPAISKTIYIQLWINLGKINFYLLTLFVILAVILNYKFSLTILSCFFSFYLFYSCYDKVVIRYILICFLMLLPLISIVISEFLFMVLNSKRLKKKQTLLYWSFLAIILVLLFSKANQYNCGKSQLTNSRTLALKSRNDLKQLSLNKNDYFICADQSYKIWTQYYYGAKYFRWKWSVAPHFSVQSNNMKQLAKVKEAIHQGKRIFFFEIVGGKYPYKYWSKLDMNLHYELTEKLRIDTATPDGETVVIYQLTPRTARVRTIQIDCSTNNSNLFILTADASNIVPTNQIVVISSAVSSITNKLYLGLNLYNLPQNFLDNTDVLTISSNTNLPAIVDASLFSTNLIFDLGDYEKISGVSRTFVKSTPLWLDNQYAWSRERKPPKANYRQPIIALSESVQFNLYNGLSEDIDISLNISTSGKTRTKNILFLLNHIDFECNGKEIDHNIIVKSWKRKYDVRHVNADISITNLNKNANHIIGADFQHCSDRIPVFLNSINITSE